MVHGSMLPFIYTLIVTLSQCVKSSDTSSSFESRSLDYLFQERHRSEPTFDQSTLRNVTTASGKTIYLPCRVRNLGDRTVSEWPFSASVHWQLRVWNVCVSRRSRGSERVTCESWRWASSRTLPTKGSKQCTSTTQTIGLFKSAFLNWKTRASTSAKCLVNRSRICSLI